MSKRIPKARPEEIDALDRFRRAQRVTLQVLAARHGCDAGWLSKALRGQKPISTEEVRLMRAEVSALARDALTAAKSPKEPAP
jgi:hypothetical protein